MLEEAKPNFESNSGVKFGGVLIALPALLANGLLQFSDKHFKLSKVFYGLNSTLLVLAFTALLRIKSLEGVRYCDPGELGKLIGLDRIPEVKTLRERVKVLSDTGNVENWEKDLSKFWMERRPDEAGLFYVDGHVRVYYGKQTKLPKRYISRDKLCLPGISDYWVNDFLGKPFFVVSKEINEGLLTTLKEDIVPRLIQDAPNQPSEESLREDKYLARFGIVFDREGYSPTFFRNIWQEHRIACFTYKKYVTADWPIDDFLDTEVRYPNGEVEILKLAERGVYYKKENFWIREIRKLNKNNHQTALITTDYSTNTGNIAAKMFSRWSQENFFKYMMENYGINKLIEHKTEKMDEFLKVVNPKYREINYNIRSSAAKLARIKAKYADLILIDGIDDNFVQRHISDKSKLKEELDLLNANIEQLKKVRKETKKHILIKDLPENEKFKAIRKKGKHFLDTIKMISYRAETMLANLLKTNMLKGDEARMLLKQIFQTETDIEINHEKKLLIIKIHNLATQKNNEYLQNLCDELNDTETTFPGTDLKISYYLASR